MEPDVIEILEANADFYRAFESLDFEAMCAAWSQQDSDVCIHPGWEILYGWPEVRESWRAIFASSAYMRFDLTDVEVTRMGKWARVTCVENLYTVHEGVTQQAKIAATNLWVLTDAGWKISLHHGSPIGHSVELGEEELLN